MRDFRDAKAMAQTLREALKTRSVTLSHSESLELVAKTLGFHDWNVLAAAIQASQPELARAIEERIRLYAEHQAFSEAARKSPSS